MTLQQTTFLIEGLISKSVKKKENKIYQEFLSIISKLKDRDFTNNEIKAIELELDKLDFEPTGWRRKTHLRKALAQFEEFIKDTFFLTSKGYYAKIGAGLGASFGILFGVVFLSNWERSLGISMGLMIGMVIGTTIGKSLDTKAQKDGSVL